MTDRQEPSTRAHVTDRERALAVRAHRITEEIARTYAREAEEAGDTEAAETFRRMARHARRNASLWSTG